MRFYRETPCAKTHIRAFNEKVCCLLKEPLVFDKDDELSPRVVHPDQVAHGTWRKLYNEVEHGITEPLADCKDVASKVETTLPAIG